MPDQLRRRIQVSTNVRQHDLAHITPAVLHRDPGILPMLRMATCPPLARDRLLGLAYADKNVVLCMEAGACPVRMKDADLYQNLQRIAATITKLLDKNVFGWLTEGKSASRAERSRAATIIADRMCGAQSDPIIRNAQEQRQVEVISKYLSAKGYIQKQHPTTEPISDMRRISIASRGGVAN